MGADWYARTVIGCEVTGKLTRKVKVPGCAHLTGAVGLAPSFTPAFCSICGKPGTKTEEVSVPGYDGERLAQWQVAGTTDHRRQFVGIVTSVDYNSQAKGATRMPGNGDDYVADIRVKLKATLEPLGLWDPDTFGIWVVLYCSY